MLFLASNNTTLGEAPHYEAHRSYIVPASKASCSYIMKLEWDEMCIFVRQNPKCHEFEWLINWMYFMFCEMDMDTTTFTTMIAIIVGIVLLIILSLVIISFVRMAPCFLATAHLLRFDEHSAGSVYLVLLTYGGDVIENAHIFNVDTSTAFNETLGSAIFTLAVFGGALAVVNQFALTPAYFVRDTVFALFGLIFTTVVYVHEEIDLHYALIFMGIYFLYLVYVLVEFLIHQALYKVESKHSQERGLDFSIDDMAPAHQPIQLKFEVNDSLQYGELEGPNTFLFKQFFTSLNPIRLDVMKEMNTFFKCCFLVGMPLHVIYILCIPCFDYKLPNHGWSKLTICVNLVLAGPILVSLFTFSGTPYIFAWIPGTLLAVAVFFTSRTDRPPKYHIAFAFLGVIMCMAFHFVLEHELMNLFHNLGLFMGIRRQTIGLSFLAWADNITLAVWISRLADWGYSRTSFAAVYMGVLLDMIYSLGLIFTIKCRNSWKYSVHTRQGVSGPTSSIYAIFLYGFVFFGVSICKFQVRKSLGVALLLYYFIYLLHSYLVEFEVIHGMGTDHSGVVYVGAKWA